MMHTAVPANPILVGTIAALLTFPVNYNDAGIDTGVRKCRIQASATKPVLLTVFANITTAFNAATTNLLTVGSSYAPADEFLAAADITEGTAGFYPASNASKKYWLTADTDLIIRYNGGVQATGTITSDNTAPVTGSSVVITDPVSGISETYTFRTALTPAEGEVLINTTADAALLNLIRAINHTGTAGTDYVKAAASKLVSAAASVTSHAFAVTALRGGTGGNSISTPVPSTSPASHMTWGASTLGSGTTGSPTAGAGNIFVSVQQIDPKNSSNLGV